nr:capsid protein [Solemoviridae sp.]
MVKKRVVKKTTGRGPLNKTMKMRSGAKPNISVQDVTIPAARNVVVGRSYPVLHSKGKHTRVCNTEVVRSVDLNAGFVINPVTCIPGALSWLASPAASWSRWRWIRLRYTYIPAAATNVTGTIAMGFLYDYLDETPTNLAEMGTLSGFTSGAVHSGAPGSAYLKSELNTQIPGAISTVLNIEERQRRWKYIGPTVLSTLRPAEANTYSPARLILAVGNSAVNIATVGTLYASYEIELSDPISARLNFPLAAATSQLKEDSEDTESPLLKGVRSLTVKEPDSSEA